MLNEASRKKSPIERRCSQTPPMVELKRSMDEGRVSFDDPGQRCACAQSSEVASRLSDDRQCVHLICGHRPMTNHRLGARVAALGIFLWCKDCRCPHLMTWAEVEAVREAVAFSEHLR